VSGVPEGGAEPLEGDSSSGANNRPGPARVAASVVGVALVALILVLATRDTTPNSRVDSHLLGELVPVVAGSTLDGGTFDIDSARGRWVLVNFFASWCVPCEREHPELVEFAREHSSDALVLTVPFGDTAEGTAAFFDEHGGDWPVLLDSKAEADAAVSFGVTRPPESYLVAPNGIVVAKWQGEISALEINQVIDDLLGVSS
jgi:cytochrome c biogenesis protein CcmG/thiol:disulfide interchange protein DsbE